MRIIFAVHTYYPAHNGVQAITQYMAEGLAKLHHEIMVISEKKNGFVEQEEHNGISIYRIGVKQKGFKFYGDKDKFFELIRAYAPDAFVAVCTQSWPFDWMISELDNIKCVKVLYTHGFTAYMQHYPIWSDLVHLHLRAFRYHWYWKKYYHRAFRYMKKYDVVVHLSAGNSSVAYADKHGLSNGVIIENAVEDSFFENSVLLDNGHFKCDKNVRFIYVANYDSNKNQKELLRAFYSSAIPGSTITFIGGTDNQYYKELVEENENLKKTGQQICVNILYGIPRKEISTYLSDSDIFVCTSKHEEYPVMLCEAAAKGLAVISSNVGHAREMDGCIVAESIEEFLDAMRYLAQNPDIRYNNGKKLRQYAELHCRRQDKIRQFNDVIENTVYKRIKEC